MPVAIIIAVILALSVLFQAKNIAHRVPSPTPTPMESSVIAVSPTPSRVPTSTPKLTVTHQPVTPTPSLSIDKMKIVKITSPKPTPTMRTEDDKQAPVLEWMSGPPDGSTVSFSGFCFPMKFYDNSRGAVWIRYSFDNSGVSDWNQNFSLCYTSVANGFHVFMVQAKDTAGNLSETISRNFTVNVPIPNTITPMPTSIVNEPLN